MVTWNMKIISHTSDAGWQERPGKRRSFCTDKHPDLHQDKIGKAKTKRKQTQQSILTERHCRNRRRQNRGHNLGGEQRHWSVDHRFAEEVQQLLRPVLGWREPEQVRVFLDKVRVDCSVQERLVTEHV